MNTNDTLLVKMIEKDMQHKGISESDYHIVGDFVTENPEQIEVKSNEVVYLCFFSASLAINAGFKISYSSGTAVAKYTPSNTSITKVPNAESPNSEGLCYQSPLITAHWSNIMLNKPYPDYLSVIVRYVKVAFTINKRCNEES